MQKAGNGNSVLLDNRADYVERMEELLWDVSTKDISQQNFKLFMNFRDIDFFFLPLYETIDVC